MTKIKISDELKCRIFLFEKQKIENARLLNDELIKTFVSWLTHRVSSY